MITVVTRSKQKKKGEKHDFGRVRHHVAYTLHTHTQDKRHNIKYYPHFCALFFLFWFSFVFLVKKGFSISSGGGDGGSSA